MSVQVVCFDMGGVLVRICHTWEEVLRISRIQPLHPHKAYGALANFSLFTPFQSGEVTIKHYLEGLRDYLGLMNIEEALRAHNAILVEEYLGVQSLVQRLRESSIQTALLSNTNDTHWAECVAGKRFPCVNMLDVRVVSQIVGANKPDPPMYAALEHAVHASGARIVYFDDHVKNVEAARERGWWAHHIDPYKETVPQMEAVLSELGVLSASITH